jgi:hypothetical protein
LFALAAVPRLTLVALNSDRLQFWEYETLAQSIVDRGGYAISRFGHVVFAFGDGNLYSFLAATVYLVCGHQPAVLAVVQAVLASLAAPVVFSIGRPALGPLVAGLGAILAALHPALLVYSLKMHPLGIDVMLLALSVYWILRAGGTTRAKLMAGATLGLCLMSQPTFFLAGVAALLVQATISRRRLVTVALPLSVAVLVASPWVARNWAIFSGPVFTSTAFEDAWKGNNPLASGSSLLPNGEPVLDAAPAGLQVRIQQANELQLNNLFASEIAEFVGRQPLTFATLTAKKFGYFWWASPQTGLLYPSTWASAYQTYFAVMLALGMVGALVILRSGNAEQRHVLAVLAAISISIAMVHALTYVEGRHRWGLEPLLLILSAQGAIVIGGWLRTEQHWMVRRLHRASGF